MKSLTSLTILTLPMLLTHALNHDVQVGFGGLAYSPNKTIASPGDTITFHFLPSHHNVAQGDYNSPCQPKQGGFYSGFLLEDTTANDVFVLTVNDTDPIWFYCSATGHCQNGMVGVINPP
jgi:plastocyanin